MQGNKRERSEPWFDEDSLWPTLIGQCHRRLGCAEFSWHVQHHLKIVQKVRNCKSVIVRVTPVLLGLACVFLEPLEGVVFREQSAEPRAPENVY